MLVGSVALGRGAQNTLICPLLEEVALLYYDSRKLESPEELDGQYHREAPVLVKMAEDRKTRGGMLKKVILERCSAGNGVTAIERVGGSSRRTF